MDVVLEVCDTYMFDWIYSTLFPLSLNSPATGPIHSLLASSNGSASNYYSSPLSSYKFEPASRYFYVEPSTYAYTTTWPRDDPTRQTLSLYAIVCVFGLVLYFTIAGLSYYFVFDKETANQPKYLKNQVRLEISQSVSSIPIMSILTVPFFWLEVRGHSKIYDTLPSDSPWYLGGWYTYLQIPLFLLFTDAFIYLIHRGLHYPPVYKRLHKPHHRWVLPTPFASHAFHPLDGYAQSVPYHVFPFIFPLQKFAYIALFIFVQIWSVMIHDGEYYADNPIINGAACHGVHHQEFVGNYGQFTTLFDRLGGTYRKPAPEMFEKVSIKKVQ